MWCTKDNVYLTNLFSLAPKLTDSSNVEWASWSLLNVFRTNDLRNGSLKTKDTLSIIHKHPQDAQPKYTEMWMNKKLHTFVLQKPVMRMNPL